MNEICRIFENYKHEGSCPVSNEEAYFAKFLTSERLLTLQISDSNFRRHILVQILTLFQYLTGDVKFKPNKLVRIFLCHCGNYSFSGVGAALGCGSKLGFRCCYSYHSVYKYEQFSETSESLCS